MKYRLFCLLFALLVLTLLAGCESVEPAVPVSTEIDAPTLETAIVQETEFPMLEINGQECFPWCHTYVPAALGLPKLSEENAGTGKITTYADALASMRVTKFRFTPTSETVVQDIALKLSTDYDEVGSIRLTFSDDSDFYDLLYIKESGIYYILDPFRSLENEGTWLSGFPETAGWGG